MKLIEAEFTHEDERRKLQQLFTKDIKQVNFAQAKEGAVLGNHFHKETIEYFLITSGLVRYNDDKIMSKGDVFVVYPEEVHKLECMTDVDYVSFLTRPYLPESTDIWIKES